jgi:hypothetical protein
MRVRGSHIVAVITLALAVSLMLALQYNKKHPPPRHLSSGHAQIEFIKVA